MINNEYYKFENKATYNEDVTAKKNIAEGYC